MVYGPGTGVSENMILDESVHLEDTLMPEEIMETLCAEGCQGRKKPSLILLMLVINQLMEGNYTERDGSKFIGDTQNVL